MTKAVFIQRYGPQTASYRYRSAIPAQQVGGTVNGGEANVLVFTKPRPEDIPLAKEAKAEGIKIVADIVDDHFRHRLLGPVYADMVKLADLVVVPTENMSGRLVKYVNRSADVIIPDPYEEALCEPHANGASKFLWFGHETNLKDIRPWAEELKDLDLTIVTGETMHLKREYLKWSPEVQTAELRKANIVLLPTRKGVEYKSPNRLVNALRAGCFPVCQDLPSYQEFRHIVWVGHFITGLKWVQHFKDELNDRVREGQRYIEKFSPEAVGKQWREVLEALCQ